MPFIALPRRDFIKPPIGGSINRNDIINSGLIMSLLMNENGGKKVIDATGNKNDGTINGTIGWTGGKFGSALNLNGTSGNHVTVATSPSLRKAVTALTLEAWIYPRNVGSRQPIITKGSYDASLGGYYLNAISYNGFLEFNVNGGATGQTIAASVKPALNKWSHVVATYKSGGLMCLYLNGVLVASATSTQAFISYSNDTIMDIGSNAVTRSEYSNMLINSVNVYNNSLSAEQIKILYTKPYQMWKHTGAQFFAYGGASNSITISVSDATTITENITMLEQSFISVADSTITTENITAIFISLINVFDAVSMTENINIASNLGNVSVFDALTVNEFVKTLLTSFVSVNDTITITDFIDKKTTLNISIVDSATITESVSVSLSSLGNLSISVADTVTVTELSAILFKLQKLFPSRSITISNYINNRSITIQNRFTSRSISI